MMGYNKEIVIEEPQYEIIQAIHSMVRGVFEKFIAGDYPPKGVKNFLGYIEPAVIASRIERDDHFMLVAMNGSSVLGVIEIRNFNHLCLLFVDADNHRQGIARRLLRSAVNRCMKNVDINGTLTVNSSPYAVYIYKKLGFVEKGPAQEQDGIIFVPMVLYIDESWMRERDTSVT